MSRWDKTTGPSAAADPVAADPVAVDRVAADPGLPSSLLEVRVRADCLEVVEFYSHGAADGLSRTLRRLGLDLRVEFDSPCG